MRQKKQKTCFKQASDAAESAGQVVRDAAAGTAHAVDETATAIATAVADAAKATGRSVGYAIQATGDYLTHSKDTAVKAAHKTLDGIERKWLDLQIYATPTTDKAKADFQKVKDQMTQTLTDAKARLVEAREVSTEAWQQNVSPSFNAAMQRANELYADAVARFGSNQPV